MRPSWRLLLHPEPLRGCRNMAFDHALLEDVQAGGAPVLRLYGWRPACLSFGRNQAVSDAGVAERLALRGIEAVRRPTGGLAVLHDHEVTYSVVAPIGLLGSPRRTHLTIARALVRGLRRLGVPAALADGISGRRPPRPSTDAAIPCFRQPAAGEIVANGRKLVGSAQRCESRTILQHGSVLLGGDQEVVAALLGVDEGDGAGTTLERLLGRAPDVADVAAALRAGFEEELETPLEPMAPRATLERRARSLESRYASAEWTWRR